MSTLREGYPQITLRTSSWLSLTTVVYVANAHYLEFHLAHKYYACYLGIVVIDAYLHYLVNYLAHNYAYVHYLVIYLAQVLQLSLAIFQPNRVHKGPSCNTSGSGQTKISRACQKRLQML